MGKLIQLSGYRKKSRLEYLAKHGNQIEEFLHGFISQNVETDYASIHHAYLAECREDQAEAWDYTEFRAALRDAFEDSYFELLKKGLSTQAWFDSRYASPKQLLELCLSIYITDEPLKVLPKAT